MKILKIVFGNLLVDTLFGLLALGLLVAWMINQNNNFTGFCLLVVGYVSFNIINKAQMILRDETKNKGVLTQFFLFRKDEKNRGQ